MTILQTRQPEVEGTAPEESGSAMTGVRSLWSLLGLPLVLFPFALIVIGAGMI